MPPTPIQPIRGRSFFESLANARWVQGMNGAAATAAPDLRKFRRGEFMWAPGGEVANATKGGRGLALCGHGCVRVLCEAKWLSTYEVRTLDCWAPIFFDVVYHEVPAG